MTFERDPFEPVLDERNSFVDAVLGAVCLLSTATSIIDASPPSEPHTADATNELLCDALVGLKSFGATLKHLFTAVELDAPEAQSSAPAAAWSREHLR